MILIIMIGMAMQETRTDIFQDFPISGFLIALKDPATSVWLSNLVIVRLYLERGVTSTPFIYSLD